MSGPIQIRPAAAADAPSRFFSSAELTPEVEEHFLSALAEFGQATYAANVCGMTRRGLYKRRARDPAFAARWEEALAAFEETLTQRVIATAIHMGTGRWVQALNERGEPELDDDFEPLMRFDCSNVDPRIAVKLIGLRVRSVNDPVSISVQNNTQVIGEVQGGPRLVTDDHEDLHGLIEDDIIDADFEVLDVD